MKKLLLLTMLLTAGMNATAQVTSKSGTGTRTSKVVSSKTGQTKKSATASNSNKSSGTQQTSKPFKGVWASKEGDMYLEMDLYAKSIGVEYGEPSHGSLCVYYMNSSDPNTIQSATISGNTAILNLICQIGGENGKVTVKLTYNPKNKSITVSNAKLIDCSMCILDGIDPITLYKKK